MKGHSDLGKGGVTTLRSALYRPNKLMFLIMAFYGICPQFARMSWR